jgi:hypothetical protein
MTLTDNPIFRLDAENGSGCLTAKPLNYQGFRAGSQPQGADLQPGHARPYLRRKAASSSTPRIFASDASHARTSAISAANSSGEPERSAVANSPNSSVSQRNVAASPRAASFWPYICKIIRCTAESVKVPDDTDVSIMPHLTQRTQALARGNRLRSSAPPAELNFGSATGYHGLINDVGVVANPRSSP